MAKKATKATEEQTTNESRDREIDEALALVKQHEEVIENFRTSFKNLEHSIALLKERNRLR
jgi:hypothetical protein